MLRLLTPEIRITVKGVVLMAQGISVIPRGIATTALTLVGKVFTMETGAIMRAGFLTVTIVGETCTCNPRGVMG